MEWTPPQWSAPARAVLVALGAADGEARLVGGAVRDGLLGLATADYDIATVHQPDEARRRIETARARAVPTGLAHGTITAVFDGGRMEVTTLRRDVSTDGRRAIVEYTRDWREDAARRDFTINALYADPLGGELLDYNDGRADLAAGRVRFIGDPLARIAEDHLRILRFFRFHARFAQGAPDPAALAACAARARDLMALSRERVRDELLKLLVAPAALTTLALMREAGVLGVVLPEAGELAPLERLAAREARLGLAPAPLRRLSALLPADQVVAGAVAARLRLSNAERRRLDAMAERLDAPPADVRALAYWRGAEGAADALMLADADADAGPDPATLAMLAGWTRPRLPVVGGDLMAAGVPAGPEIARRLAEIERAWVAGGFTATPAALLAGG